MISNLIKWLDFAILNQEKIKREWTNGIFPQWNIGYLEALLDVKKQIELIEVDIFNECIKKASSSVGSLDFRDAHYKGD